MKEVQWLTSEVISFLEEKLINNEATYEEEQLYIKYKWTGKINKASHTYKMLVQEMNEIYEG